MPSFAFHVVDKILKKYIKKNTGFLVSEFPSLACKVSLREEQFL